MNTQPLNDPRTGTDRRNPEQLELRRLILAGALMAHRLRATGSADDAELADAWERSLLRWREGA